jgi:uncharacterized protein YjbI with pentapeptide repeats
MPLGRRSALMDIIRTTRMVARPTVITVRAGLWMECLLALAPGTTTGDIRITNATTVATLMIDLRDADLKDMALRNVVLIDTVFRDVVGRFGAALKGADEAKASMEGSEVAAKN